MFQVIVFDFFNALEGDIIIFIPVSIPVIDIEVIFFLNEFPVQVSYRMYAESIQGGLYGIQENISGIQSAVMLSEAVTAF